MGYLGELRRLFNVSVYDVGDFTLEQESELLCFLNSFKICSYVGFIMFFGRKKRILYCSFFKTFESYHAANLILSLEFLSEIGFVASLTSCH